MGDGKFLEKKILNTFTELAGTLGYSPVHGRIIGVLLIKGRPVSLQELAKSTGYSSSMVSLSLDLLEILGVIRKVKKSADRKLYVELTGDLLSCLKNALLVKVKKGIDNSLSDFEESSKLIEKAGPEERKRLRKVIETLESEIKRLDRYVTMLSGIKLP